MILVPFNQLLLLIYICSLVKKELLEMWWIEKGIACTKKFSIVENKLSYGFLKKINPIRKPENILSVLLAVVAPEICRCHTYTKRLLFFIYLINKPDLSSVLLFAN